MAARIAAIADAVLAELNTGYFSLKFTAKESYLPVFKLDDMDCLHVTVVKSSKSREVIARNQDQTDYQIWVSVQQRCRPESDKKPDALMALVDEIEDRFIGKPLGNNLATCIAVVNEPIYSPKHLEELNQFTSVLLLTFRAHVIRN